MWGNYGAFLDYLELRRRVEKRLLSSNLLLLHIGLFVLVTVLALVQFTNYYRGGGTYSSQSMAQFMGVWSVLLLLHALWTGVRSGAWAGRRSRAIETEMRRMLHEDTFVQDAQNIFRLHGLLEQDIQSRANNTLPLVIFAAVNATNWVGSGGGYLTSYPWWVTPILALFVLLPILAFNLWRSERRTRKLTQILSSGEPAARDKPKRDVLHLADDGEVMDIGEEDEYENPKRSVR